MESEWGSWTNAEGVMIKDVAMCVHTIPFRRSPKLCRKIDYSQKPVDKFVYARGK